MFTVLVVFLSGLIFAVLILLTLATAHTGTRIVIVDGDSRVQVIAVGLLAVMRDQVGLFAAAQVSRACRGGDLFGVVGTVLILLMVYAPTAGVTNTSAIQRTVRNFGGL